MRSLKHIFLILSLILTIQPSFADDFGNGTGVGPDVGPYAIGEIIDGRPLIAPDSEKALDHLYEFYNKRILPAQRGDGKIVGRNDNGRPIYVNFTFEFDASSRPSKVAVTLSEVIGSKSETVTIERNPQSKGVNVAYGFNMASVGTVTNSTITQEVGRKRFALMIRDTGGESFDISVTRSRRMWFKSQIGCLVSVKDLASRTHRGGDGAQGGTPAGFLTSFFLF